MGYYDPITQCLNLHTTPLGVVLCEPGPFAAVHATVWGAHGDATEAARWLYATNLSAMKIVEKGYGGEYERYLKGVIHAPPYAESTAAKVRAIQQANAQQIAEIIESWGKEPPRELWHRLKSEGWESLLPVPGGRWLGPQNIEEVARNLVVSAWSLYHLYYGPDHSTKHTGNKAITLSGLSNRVAPITGNTPFAVWQGTADTLQLPDDLASWVIYMDPPYKGDGTRKIAGYPSGDCTRETVIQLAKTWTERGAVVAISECVSLKSILGEGWHEVNITSARSGSRRTLGNTPEWLTINRKPGIPEFARQPDLFGYSIQ